MRKVTVIGAGLMGHGIAQIFAMAEYEVAIVDINDQVLREAKKKIQWSLDKLVERQRIGREEADTALSRITTTTTYEQAAADADLVIEASPENMELKRKVFAKLDKTAPARAILASNTSALSITEMGRATARPGKVAGMHFFNPPQIMKLVEVVRGDHTSSETIETLLDLAKKLGKTPVIVRKDVRGFIVNRILGSVFNEAFWAHRRGEATKEGIDASVKYAAGFPMGWFELVDFIGLDVIQKFGEVLYEAYGERFKHPPDVIEPLIKEHRFGQKTGIGFYDWTKGKPSIPSSLQHEYDVGRSWAVAVNEAAWLIHEDAANADDIDIAMRLGAGWPSGPCEYADRIGMVNVLNKLEELYTKHDTAIYRSCPLLKEYVNKSWKASVR